MIALLRTYLDVIALRKGPDAIPPSWLLLFVSFGLLAIAWVLQFALLNGPVSGVLPALLAYLLALGFYASVASALGFRRRVLQMLSTIVACGSLLAIVSATTSILLRPILGAQIAVSLGTLIWFWSVPVKGHIVARTVQKHWFFGIGIAMLAFILRFGVEASFFSSAEASAY